jgi:hypothetical protein
MTPEKTHNYSEFVTENEMDLEVKGEVFSSPIKRTQNGEEFHTRVEIINISTQEVINRMYFKKENNPDELKQIVIAIKSEPKYLNYQA